MDAVREASRECLLNRLCEFLGTELAFNSDLQKETILHGKIELIMLKQKYDHYGIGYIFPFVHY